MEMLIAGGDRRHELLCELARMRGWHVMSMGLPGSAPCAGRAQVVVLPMPCARAGYIPAPLVERALRLDDIVPHVAEGARVYCGGVCDELRELAKEYDWRIIDMYADEAFARRNALLSAEGAVYAAMRERDAALAGSLCLIVGFGRIGQMLAMQLMGLGARVRVAARREESRALAQCMGCEAVDTDALELAVGGCGVIFNTVPVRILDERVLLRVDAGALIVETASAPYGVDFDCARALGVRALREGGIPGRYCPRTAAAVMLDAIESVREEI